SDTGPHRAAAMDAQQMMGVRDLFWDNVVRDMLNALSVMAQQQPDQFDGRFAVLTRSGERIPIAHVFPLFACSISGSQEDRDMSAAVQCTVFRIVTPSGEVFTLPVHEIRAMHTLSSELVERLQRSATKDDAGTTDRSDARGDKDATDDDEERPFGFAAYTSLPKLPPMPAPDQPQE
ncbi:MAG: hypothetical protein K2Q20_13540, partial [Phycisphaerales bacterium]|nr:hypothetical protein [Phycisphaerales bacterium]